ncbi:hypothetical protein GW17_00029952 [Ensete ventricosum]|nr:hypothetical protein GW17_00029952 [Ensete ventricosum]
MEARPICLRSPAIAQPFIPKSPSPAKQFGEHGRLHPKRPSAAISRMIHLLLLLRCGRLASLQTLLFGSPYNLRLTSATAARGFCSNGISDLRGRILLLSENPASVATEDKEALRSAVSALADQLLALPDGQDLAAPLDSGSFAALLHCSPAGFASVELLSRLKSRPLLALQVFNWRKKLADAGIPMLPEEYSKAITLAGRTKNVDLAAELFSDAIDASLRNACLYNALMSAYMYNGLIEKAVSVFEDLKQDFNCKPTIVTYNILLSVFGRFLLVDHMETVLQAIDDSYLSYTITTYNTAIAAYVTAWMWDKMERMYQSMVEGPIKPDTDTLLLMLRGYAYSSNLEKMEKTYDQIKEMVNDRQTPLIRTMIDAYTKSCHLDRVRKVEALMKLIPEDDYRACLNVRLIRMYAQEGLIEAMEGLISKAFQHNTVVTAVGVMRSIISSYFKSNEVDRLAGFIRQAENAGWRLCRSLYHCKMVMYGQQNRLEEMHGVLDEMENFRFDRTKKTFFILYKGYSNIGRRLEAETVIGMMWKHGYGNPEDACVS